MSKINLSYSNAKEHFYIKPLSEKTKLEPFDCSLVEYNYYLLNDALRSKNDHITHTWLLIDCKNENIAAYMSLIIDAIKLSFTEEELHNLNYPFRTIPAMKIAKLAVDINYLKKYKGIGTFMIDTAERFALACNDDYCAARFITVDADIEHDTALIAFYEKNGFIPNSELIKKNSKTISMRKDIYF